MKNSRFVNVAVVSGTVEDDLYAVIERGGEYFVVTLDNNNERATITEKFYVDDGITVIGNDIRHVGGLGWLEGEEVAVLADGHVLPRQVVKDGDIKISENHGYNRVHVGLPIDAEIKTLPIEFNGQDGSYLSRKKRITSISILFKNTRGGLFGTDENRLDEIKWRTNEPWNAPISMYTGKKKVTVPSENWADTRQITIRQDDPLPMTVLALVPEIEAGG